MEKVDFLICFKDTVCGQSKKKEQESNIAETVLYLEGYRLELPKCAPVARHWNHEPLSLQVP